MNNKARVIAFYLPQYHPIHENDQWWGKGFTEWTNVGKAKPVFKGHYQPKVPADLGYYDLRMPEIREAQAELAQEAGIEGFCYWHYWFGNGKQLLEKPFDDVLELGKPDYPFCLGWANHSWTNKDWHIGNKFAKEGCLIEQIYPGKVDQEQHFYYVLKAFQDKRYILVDGKPLFLIYSPVSIPEVNKFIKFWNELAVYNGLKGIHFVGITHNLSSLNGNSSIVKGILTKLDYNNSAEYYNKILDLGFDAVNSRGQNRAEILVKGRLNKLFLNFINAKLDGVIVDKYNYKKIIKYLFVDEDSWENVYPTIIPNWDRSPRSGKKALIWHNCTPELFRESIRSAIDLVKNKKEEHRILFLQSWNEWGEGNYVEPDLKFGKAYLNVLKDMLK